MSHIITKRHTFYLLNIIISLVIGLTVYVCYRPDTFVSNVVYKMFGTRPDVEMYTSMLPQWLTIFIQNYLADILWAYALTFTVSYIWLDQSGSALQVFGIVAVFEFFMEFSQKIDIMPGTFDWMDIVLEICITALLMPFIKTLCKEN